MHYAKWVPETKVLSSSKKQQFWHTVQTVVVVSAVTRKDLCYEKNCLAAAKVKFWKIHSSSGNIK